MILDDLMYTEGHEWVDRTGDGTVKVGITDYRQGQLGEMVYVKFPEVGRKVTAGTAIGEVESTTSVTSICAPVRGEIVAVNDELDAQPDLINSDPFGEGWIVELRPDAPESLKGLLDATGYRDRIGED